MPDALRLARAVRELLATPDSDWAHLPRLIVDVAMVGILGRWEDVADDLIRDLEAAVGVKVLRKWARCPGRTHADVLSLLDRVIAEMEAEQ